MDNDDDSSRDENSNEKAPSLTPALIAVDDHAWCIITKKLIILQHGSS